MKQMEFSKLYDCYPLSFAQQRLWFLDQLVSGNANYNLPTALKLKGKLNLQVLKQTFQLLIERHDALRTEFPIKNGSPVQLVHLSQNAPAFDLDVIKITENKISQFIQDIINIPFNLSKDRLMRVYLFDINLNEHVLLINLHHIICDGWSIHVLLNELQIIYTALFIDREVKLPLLACNYGTYADQQLKSYEKMPPQSHLLYWIEKLKDCPTIINLMTDFPRPAKVTNQGNHVSIELSLEQSKQYRDFAKKFEVSSFMLGLAAFYLTLSLYSEQDDIVIGSPVANRNQSEYNNLIGLFVNIVPLRLNYSKKINFIELLKELKFVTLNALVHQDFPFEKIIEKIQPLRDINISPLFQVMFVQIVSGKVPSLPDLELSTYQITGTNAKYDLTMYLQDNGHSPLQIFLEYNADIFEESTVLQMLKHWQQGLMNAVMNPYNAIEEISFLAQNEKELLHQNLNTIHSSATDEDKSIIELFEEQVIKNHHKISLIHLEQQITYDNLNKLANKIAWQLLMCNTAVEDYIGLVMERSIERIAAIIGILKVGGIYVPIDPNHPQVRIKNIIEQTKLKIILTQHDFLTCLPFGDYKSIAVDTEHQVINQKTVNPPHINILKKNAAYIIFTSGSTGVPKGVIGLHGGILNRIRWTWENYPLLFGEICCHQAAVSFVDSVAEIFTPLLCGTPAVIFPSEVIKDPILLLKSLVEYRISRIVMIPSLLNIVIDVCEQQKEFLPYLKLWSTSGEALTKEIVDKFFKVFQNRCLLNIYGSSEVAADATYFETRKPILQRHVPIGKPLRNIRTYILDKNFQPVPIGIKGEIYVSGEGISRGYLNNPELTDSRFIPNPMTKETDDIFYRTGDLGRYQSDGNIQFLRRNDSQIKIRGMRVELSEIEAVILKNKNIIDACVCFSEKLIAFVIIKPTQIVHENQLRDSLREYLPDYMIPTSIITLESFPRTVTGKVDRNSLALIRDNKEKSDDNINNVVFSSHSPTARTILEIWKKALKIEKIGMRDNFFDKGGHSLLLVEVRNAISLAINRELSILELFQYPTIESLAKYLDKKTSYVTHPQLISKQESTLCKDIAIIGMSGRFPEANNVEIFWHNLVNKKCSIIDFSDEDTSNFLQNEKWVKKGGVIENIELFDSLFFNLTSLEAKLLDPQHRIFLECVWESLEKACYDPDTYLGKIGVYAGSSQSTYLLSSLLPELDLNNPNHLFSVLISNNENYLATRAAYKFNLRGPCISIQTACSTSLVAVHTACRALIANECDMAIAGGTTVKTPQKIGYSYQEGSVVSPNGRCSAFDHKANGTVFSNGAGVVVLKRLEDAKRDGDIIHAVIKGSAVNNDGAEKVGYTAPSINGQTEVICEALANSKVDPSFISYIEAHGTGTTLGDPIELKALQQAFSSIPQKQTCGIGSVKTNIGHLDAAAGVASLIKVVMALKHQILPATLYFEQGNPAIDWQNIPFYVVKENTPWLKTESPRYAGVSSFGIGGTNAHLILTEAPEASVSQINREYELIVLSARTATALQTMRENLAQYLMEHPQVNLASVAHTLQIGRKAFEYRFMAICSDLPRTIAALKDLARPSLEWSELKEQLENLGQRWLQGENINWKSFFKSPYPQKVELPTYPFERQFFWIKPAYMTSENIHSPDLKFKPRPTLTVEFVKFRNEIEEQLVSDWELLLNIQPIGIHDDFFALGGHSLLATQAVSAITSKFSTDFSLQIFFENTTIAKIAVIIEDCMLQKLYSMSEQEISELL